MKYWREGLLFLILSVLFGYLATHYYYYPCAHPISYHLGTIDPRFNLKPTEAGRDLKAASDLWNTAQNQVLFQVDPASRLVVNFVYDTRQGLAAQINTEKTQVDTSKTSLDSRITAFNAKIADFKNRVSQFNADAADVSPDNFDSLLARQKALQAESLDLQSQADQLNKSASGYTLQVSQLNTNIDSFNTLLSQKPEEGIYDSNSDVIEIYFVTDRNELIHTLTHEFGHALDLNHVSDPQSVMYAFTGKSLSLTPADRAELTRACRRIGLISRLKPVVNEIHVFFRQTPITN